jgi:hypothetical protein
LIDDFTRGPLLPEFIDVLDERVKLLEAEKRKASTDTRSET